MCLVLVQDTTFAHFQLFYTFLDEGIRAAHQSTQTNLANSYTKNKENKVKVNDTWPWVFAQCTNFISRQNVSVEFCEM